MSKCEQVHVRHGAGSLRRVAAIALAASATVVGLLSFVEPSRAAGYTYPESTHFPLLVQDVNHPQAIRVDRGYLSNSPTRRLETHGSDPGVFFHPAVVGQTPAWSTSAPDLYYHRDYLDRQDHCMVNGVRVEIMAPFRISLVGAQAGVLSTIKVPTSIVPHRPELSAAESHVVWRINQLRASKGLAPLSVDTRLSLAADSHSGWQSEVVGDHTGRYCTQPYERARDAGYPSPMTTSEMIHGGTNDDRAAPPDPDFAVDGWTGSPTHHAIMMQPDVTCIGVGNVFLWTVKIADAEACDTSDQGVEGSFDQTEQVGPADPTPERVVTQFGNLKASSRSLAVRRQVLTVKGVLRDEYGKARRKQSIVIHRVVGAKRIKLATLKTNASGAFSYSSRITATKAVMKRGYGTLRFSYAGQRTSVTIGGEAIALHYTAASKNVKTRF